MVSLAPRSQIGSVPVAFGGGRDRTDSGMIQGIGSIGATSLRLASGAPTGGLAAAIAGELSGRAAAWVATLSGGGSAEAGFRADMSLLARGGDIYGIAELTRDVAARIGASAAEEGALQRAVEDFTREAVIASANGSDSSQRPVALDEAVAAARSDADGAETADDVIGRLEAATAHLRG